MHSSALCLDKNDREDLLHLFGINKQPMKLFLDDDVAGGLPLEAFRAVIMQERTDARRKDLILAEIIVEHAPAPGVNRAGNTGRGSC